jgi:hypothetical protein
VVIALAGFWTLAALTSLFKAPRSTRLAISRTLNCQTLTSNIKRMCELPAH